MKGVEKISVSLWFWSYRPGYLRVPGELGELCVGPPQVTTYIWIGGGHWRSGQSPGRPNSARDSCRASIYKICLTGRNESGRDCSSRVGMSCAASAA